MVSKIAISVAAGVALLTAAVRLPATPCFVTNTPSPKACELGCCHNQTCCATSHERTGPSSQPLTKSSSDQTLAAIPAMSAVAVVIRDAADLDFVSSGGFISHSPAPLAVSCIRLI